MIPYQPVTDALQASAGAADALAQAPQPLRARLAPLMERRAGPRSEDPAGPQQPFGADTPEDQRGAFLAAIGQLFARMASAAPVLLVVEEAECIDRASAQLLRHLAHSLPERLLLLMCFRDPSGSRHPPLQELLADLEGRGVADRLALEPLTEPDLAALVASWTDAEAPAGLRAHAVVVHGRQPVVRQRGGPRPRRPWRHRPHRRRVPRGVRDVLRERLRTLSATAQAVIAYAAVLGREFSIGLLTQVADEPEERVVDALEEAVHATSRPGHGSGCT